MTSKTDAAGIVDRLEDEYRKTVEALNAHKPGTGKDKDAAE